MIPCCYLLLPAALLLAAPAALAQTTPAPAYDLAATHRYVQPTQLWPQVQLEAIGTDNNSFLLAFQGRRMLHDGYAANRSLGFDARQAVVGYEYTLDPVKLHWRLGGTVRLLGSDAPVAVIPEVLVQQRSPLAGRLWLGQRLSLERTFSSGTAQALESGPAGQFWTRLRIDAEQLVTLGSGKLALRPRLSYEAATHLRLQKADTDPDERTIQYTSLRVEAGLRVSRAFDLTPWFAYQTRYLETLPQYDANNNPTAGGKINLVYPTFGLDLRYTLRAVPGPDLRVYRQQPTQY